MGRCVNENVEENLEIARDRMKKAYDEWRGECGIIIISVGNLVVLVHQEMRIRSTF